jgi:hypothetical protein
MTHHEACGRARARYRHANLHTAIGGRAPQFLGNRPCVAEEAREATQIDDDFRRV